MRTYSITGGKGGVGKTTLTINLAFALAKRGYRVLLFDADLGLANIDVLLNLKARKTMLDVMLGRAMLNDILVPVAPNIQPIPSASGIQKLAELTVYEIQEIIQQFSVLPDHFDILLVDTAAGVTQQVLQFTQAAEQILLTVCNDPASMADSYATIKLLFQNFSCHNIGIVANRVQQEKEGLQIYKKLQTITERFLPVHLEYIGEVLQDDYVLLSARHRKAVVEEFPGSRAAKSIVALSGNILKWETSGVPKGGISYFFERMLQCREIP